MKQYLLAHANNHEHINMVINKNAALGFLISPIAPTVLLSLYGIYKSFMVEGGANSISIGESIWFIFLSIFFGYIFAAILGIPVYLFLNTKGITSAVAYSISGVFIGTAVYLLFNIPIFLSLPVIDIGSIWLRIEGSLNFLFFLLFYGVSSAISFWFIAIFMDNRNKRGR